jgi:hypothetical protein
MNITRDVIRDLWALCEASEASSDSRRLVDDYLANEPGLAESLRAGYQCSRRTAANVAA